MTQFKSTKSGYNWNGHTERFTKAFQEEARPRMTAVVNQLVSLRAQLSPVDQGGYRNSLAPRVDSPAPSQVAGSVVAQGDPIKTSVIEGVDQQGKETQYGRKPGKGLPVIMEPGVRKPQVKTNILVHWVRRKYPGISPQAARQLAYIFARKIKEEGIPAVRPAKIAFQMKQAEIEREFKEELPAAINRRLAK